MIIVFQSTSSPPPPSSGDNVSVPHVHTYVHALHCDERPAYLLNFALGCCSDAAVTCSRCHLGGSVAQWHHRSVFAAAKLLHTILWVKVGAPLHFPSSLSSNMVFLYVEPLLPPLAYLLACCCFSHHHSTQVKPSRTHAEVVDECDGTELASSPSQEQVSPCISTIYPSTVHPYWSRPPLPPIDGLGGQKKRQHAQLRHSLLSLLLCVLH